MKRSFYQCYDGDLTLTALRPALRGHEDVYNTVRPHQALGYATPLAWLQAHQQQKTDRSRLAEARLPLPKADSTTISRADV